MSAKMTSVIIVTFNRKDLLYKAIKSVQNQTIPTEIIVMDDASSDGTENMIKKYFPEVNYNKSNINLGPSLQRNYGAQKAKSEIIFFIDDDTILNDSKIIEETLLDFTHPKIAAVSIPFINVLINEEVHGGMPRAKETLIYHSFIAAAFAIRKNIFIDLNGFRKEYFFMGEEGDLCIRILNTGNYIKGGTSAVAQHFQLHRKKNTAADYYGRRNDILFTYLNVPKNKFFSAVVKTIVKGIIHGIKIKKPLISLKGLYDGLMLIKKNEIKELRNPVDLKIYKLFKFLKKNEPITIEIFKPK